MGEKSAGRLRWVAEMLVGIGFLERGMGEAVRCFLIVFNTR